MRWVESAGQASSTDGRSSNILKLSAIPHNNVLKVYNVLLVDVWCQSASGPTGGGDTIVKVSGAPGVEVHHRVNAGGVEPIDLHCVVRGVGSPPACASSPQPGSRSVESRVLKTSCCFQSKLLELTLDEVVAGVLGTDSIPIESERGIGASPKAASGRPRNQRARPR